MIEIHDNNNEWASSHQCAMSFGFVFVLSGEYTIRAILTRLCIGKNFHG